MKTIFDCIIGSHAYGTNIETSDIDQKFVYCQDKTDILGLKYQEQVNPDKDTSGYELRRFIELAGSANPNILEMLFVDSQFIKVNSPAFQHLIDNRKLFLTKQCAQSFGGYAVAQIKKARGLDKKINWEKERVTRKTPLDFCYVMHEGKSLNIVDWLKSNDMKQEFVGLAALDRMPGCYSIFYDYPAQYGKEFNTGLPPTGFRGIVFEDSNDIRLSSIPKGQMCFGVLYYNKDAYSLHCKEFLEYEGWLKNSNPQRRIDTQKHGQQIDGKNLMHCVRLINCALEIGTTENLTVYRPEREELLKIRRGECVLEDIIRESEEKIKMIDQLFKDSSLPDSLSLEAKHQLLIKCRELVYDIS